MGLPFSTLRIFSHFAIYCGFLLWCVTHSAQSRSLDTLKQRLKQQENSNTFNENSLEYTTNLNEIGSIYLYKNLDSLFYYSSKAKNLAVKNNFVNEQIISLIQLAHYNFNIGKHTESLDLLAKSLKLARFHKNKNEGAILNKIGLYQYDLGNHSEALKYYLACIEVGKKQDDNILLSIAKENVALIYIAQKDFNQALQIYKEVAAINDKLGNEQYIAETKANIADLYRYLKDFDNAKLTIDFSISIFEKNSSLEWLSSCYKTKGDIYLDQNKTKLALYWYAKSLELHENLNDDIYKAPLLNGIAQAHIQQNNLIEAEKFALSSVEISEKLRLLENTTSSYRILHEIYKKDAKPELALKYHEKYKQYSDSISRKENLNSLGNLKTKLEFEKQQKDATLANEKELAKQNIYMYLFLFALGVLGLIIFLLRRQSRIRKSFNTILRLKTKALEKRELGLNEINNTKDKLFSIIGHDLRGPINALAGILKMLQDQEIDEEEFKQFLPKVSTDVEAISFTLNNLLSWGTTQMNGGVHEPSDVNLHTAIVENIKLLNQAAKKKKISVTNTVSSNSMVWADKNQLDIILRNLLNNAIKFTFEGGEIVFSATEINHHVQISLKDNGVGISEELQKTLFSSNNHFTSTYGTANEKGTGLGLTLCKEMILKNDGEIWVESNDTKGATFYFTLPKKNESK